VNDLVIFVAIVGVMAAVGIAVGMIAGRRIDRIVEARSETADEPAAPEEDQGR
jgi:ABC-type dipeptide/oligopeptide/nickel transport system permease subunit